MLACDHDHDHDRVGGERMIRVIVVDDQALIRDALRVMLGVAEDLEVVAEAGDGLEAIEVLTTAAVDVALVDGRMPRLDGPGLIERLRSSHPHLPCIVLTTFDDEDLLLAALAAGAKGYLLKDASPAEVGDAIRRVHEGGTVLGSVPAARLVARVVAEPVRVPVALAAELTERERDVLDGVLEGLSNREIAQRLFLSTGSVKNHVTAILRKHGDRDRAQLISRYAR